MTPYSEALAAVLAPSDWRPSLPGRQDHFEFVWGCVGLDVYQEMPVTTGQMPDLSLIWDLRAGLRSGMERK